MIIKKDERNSYLAPFLNIQHSRTYKRKNVGTAHGISKQIMYLMCFQYYSTSALTNPHSKQVCVLFTFNSKCR